MKNAIYPFIRKIASLFYLSCLMLVVISSNLNAADNIPDKGVLSDSDKSQIPSHQLLLFYNMGYAKNSGLNDASKKNAEEIAAEYTADGYSGYSAGKTQKADMNYGGGLEYRFFYDSLGFGFGAGFHDARAETKVNNPDSDITTHTDLFAMYITATINYRYVIDNLSYFVVGAGIGGYNGWIGIGYRGASSETAEQYQIYSDAIGYHMKLDYNFLLGPVCLTAGIGAKYVKFKEFEDDDNKKYTDKNHLNPSLTGVYCSVGAGIAW